MLKWTNQYNVWIHEKFNVVTFLLELKIQKLMEKSKTQIIQILKQNMFCISIHYHSIIYNSKMKVIIFGWHCFSFNLLLAAATVPRTWDDILQHFMWHGVNIGKWIFRLSSAGFMYK